MLSLPGWWIDIARYSGVKSTSGSLLGIVRRSTSGSSGNTSADGSISADALQHYWYNRLLSESSTESALASQRRHVPHLETIERKGQLRQQSDVSVGRLVFEARLHYMAEVLRSFQATATATAATAPRLQPAASAGSVDEKTDATLDVQRNITTWRFESRRLLGFGVYHTKTAQ